MAMTGRDPLKMTYVFYRGVLDRADRLRRWKLGLGPSELDRQRMVEDGF